ncbi:very short patch repair endonuclease [Streptomyces triticirhizae]|uniref:very short patch repair endonuclease n=1 Tax=Streptomyces triticirhizae TaxID=2483353 RepID=UPI001F2DBF89|nr:very short patch repair endonuclease [Streptomyces triticirhizae]
MGEVDEGTRAANLRAAWALAHAAGLAASETLPSDSGASSPESRAVMRANRGRDTKPELLLRSLLHQRGLRYRVSIRPLPDLRRTADVVFPKARVAVFVDGCFWHGCPEHHRPATKRAEFWREKIEGNRARDAETSRLLLERGWRVVRAWEHEDLSRVAERIDLLVRARRPVKEG